MAQPGGIESDYYSTALALATAGLVSSLALSVVGAAYGTYRSAVGALHAFLPRNGYGEEAETLLPAESHSWYSAPGGVVVHLRLLIPTIMSGIVAIYGLIISVILAAQMNSANFGLVDGYRGLAAGLVCGLCCLAAGVAQGMIGYKAAGGLYAGHHLIPIVLQLVFAEALGLYGLIMGLVLLAAKGH